MLISRRRLRHFSDDYFVPKSNVAFERHLFRQITRASAEAVDQFVSKFRQRAASCDFGVREDDYIRDQVIKDPVLTIRHCARVFVLVFTRRLMFLRSSA